MSKKRSTLGASKAILNFGKFQESKLKLVKRIEMAASHKSCTDEE